VVSFNCFWRELLVNVLPEKFREEFGECFRWLRGDVCARLGKFQLLLFLDAAAGFSVASLTFRCESRLGNATSIVPGGARETEHVPPLGRSCSIFVFVDWH
jgi:hypothetical protein